MTDYISLTWDEFQEQYKPMLNHIIPNHFGEQYMFETYGEEDEFVRTLAEQNRVWTLTQVEYGTGIYNGYHWVNRLGYFVTEVPYPEDTEFEVDLCIDACEVCDKPFDDDGYACQEDDGDLTCNNCCGHEDCK